MSACATSNTQLLSLPRLLASQGVVSPSYVDSQALEGGDWWVTTRDPLRQIAPNVCRTNERSFSVYASGRRLRIVRVWGPVQMIALKTCASVTTADLVTVRQDAFSIPDLDDATLLKLLDHVFTLPQMAAAGSSEDVRFRYAKAQEGELRMQVAKLDPKTLRRLSMSRTGTLEGMVAHFPVASRLGSHLAVVFRFNSGQLTDVRLTIVGAAVPVAECPSCRASLDG
jgi:hypothetical protein